MRHATQKRINIASSNSDAVSNSFYSIQEFTDELGPLFGIPILAALSPLCIARRSLNSFRQRSGSGNGVGGWDGLSETTVWFLKCLLAYDVDVKESWYRPRVEVEMLDLNVSIGRAVEAARAILMR